MKILAIDCCLKLTGVALMLDDEVDFEREDLGRRQSSELPKMTERILRKHGVTWSELDYVALTNGPGYFTGIRVGAAYASGVAYACGVKVVPVSSLDVLENAAGGEKVLVLVYAGHGFVYAQCKNFLEPGEYSHEKILAWLKENPDAKLISDDPERTGLGEVLHDENTRERSPLNSGKSDAVKLERTRPDILQVRPSMLSLCTLARQKINHAVNPAELKILYYRAPQGVS